jgi:predicted GIY-YIG superfamily endonuclease
MRSVQAAEADSRFSRTCVLPNTAASAYLALYPYDSAQIRAGVRNATVLDMRGIGARFVYILRSDGDSSRHYVGRTSNVDERLAWHNTGPCGYTLQHRPWREVVSLEFPDESQAARFERYLKTGSGRAFAKRHF